MKNEKLLPIKPEMKPGRKKMWYKHPTLRTILRGLILALPIMILLLVLSMLLRLIFNIISPISYFISPGSTDPHWIFHVLSVIILLTIFYGIGVFIKHRAGNYYFNLIEREYLSQIPLYSTLRDLVQQFTGLKEMPFSQVVLIDPFDSGVLMTGFITERVTEDIYTVFVPTAPNPTNGNIYHVPLSRLTLLNTKADTAMRTIIGMGTGSSELFTKNAIRQLREEAEEKE